MLERGSGLAEYILLFPEMPNDSILCVGPFASTFEALQEGWKLRSRYGRFLCAPLVEPSDLDAPNRRKKDQVQEGDTPPPPAK